MGHRGSIQTVYEDREKKGISVKFNPEAASEIEAYMDGLEEMMEAYMDNKEIINGLREVKVKANALLISSTPEDEIIQGIRQMTTISGPNGEKINIAGFGKAKSEQIQDVDFFKEKTLRKLNQTIKNTIFLLQWQEDEALSEFVNQLKELDQTISGHELDIEIREILQLGGFNIYQRAKDEHIKEWLRPFQDLLGKSIESLTQEEIQDAVRRTKIVMHQRLNEGNLAVYPDPDKLKEFNVKNHDMVHGDSEIFWLSNPLMDEFVTFIQSILARFTFMLDKQYLIFRFKNEPYLYLIGFSNEAFLKAEKGEGSSLVISPHVKAIIQGKDKAFRELNKSSFPSVGMYIDVLKETLKPFFIGLSEKIDFDFSDDFKRHFKM